MASEPTLTMVLNDQRRRGSVNAKLLLTCADPSSSSGFYAFSVSDAAAKSIPAFSRMSQCGPSATTK
jgi:hypothetical protein